MQNHTWPCRRHAAAHGRGIGDVTDVNRHRFEQRSETLGAHGIAQQDMDMGATPHQLMYGTRADEARRSRHQHGLGRAHAALRICSPKASYSSAASKGRVRVVISCRSAEVNSWAVARFASGAGVRIVPQG